MSPQRLEILKAIFRHLAVGHETFDHFNDPRAGKAVTDLLNQLMYLNATPTDSRGVADLGFHVDVLLILAEFRHIGWQLRGQIWDYCDAIGARPTVEVAS